MIKTLLSEDLKKAVKKLGFESTDIVLSIQEKADFGDYSSNIPLQLANQKSKKNYQSPKDIASDILESLGHPHYLERTEIAGPGFINFFIQTEYLAENIEDIIHEKEFYGSSKKHQGKNARVEYVSANPTGPLHIGNARGGPIGDVVANVLQSQGYEVLREYIHNDVGGQVLKLGIVLAHKIGYPDTQEVSEKPDDYNAPYIDELAPEVQKRIIQETGEDLYQNLSSQEFEQLCSKYAVEVLLEENLEVSQNMGINFNLVVYESLLKKEAPGVIDELKNKGVVKDYEGATWFAPSDEFLKDRETVVQKSNGEYTYFASDIVYHKQKFSSDPDLVIDVFGSNHHGHIPKLQAVVKALGYDSKKLKFILYQYVSLKRGNEVVKMSKRAGNFITAKEVLDEVGKDAFRFMMLNISASTHLDFDINLAKEQSSKNPVFYVQYAYARINSVLLKADYHEQEVDYGLLKHQRERELTRHLLEFPGLVEEVSKTFAVHQLTTYAIHLAELFHSFYEECSILYAEGEDLKNARLRLAHASKIVLANLLDLLGISAPEKM